MGLEHFRSPGSPVVVVPQSVTNFIIGRSAESHLDYPHVTRIPTGCTVCMDWRLEGPTDAPQSGAGHRQSSPTWPWLPLRALYWEIMLPNSIPHVQMHVWAAVVRRLIVKSPSMHGEFMWNATGSSYCFTFRRTSSHERPTQIQLPIYMCTTTYNGEP